VLQQILTSQVQVLWNSTGVSLQLEYKYLKYKYQVYSTRLTNRDDQYRKEQRIFKLLESCFQCCRLAVKWIGCLSGYRWSYILALLGPRRLKNAEKKISFRLPRRNQLLRRKLLLSSLVQYKNVVPAYQHSKLERSLQPSLSPESRRRLDDKGWRAKLRYATGVVWDKNNTVSQKHPIVCLHLYSVQYARNLASTT